MPKKKSSFTKATKQSRPHIKNTKKTTKKLHLGKKSPNLNVKLVTGVILLIIGAYLLNQYQGIKNAKKVVIPAAQTKDAPNEPIQASDDLVVPRNTKDPLVRILMPTIDVDKNIVEAEIVGGYWELSENSASHGLGSAYPGMKGNTIIFAHAREGLFLNLRNIAVGEEILVFTKNKWFKYNVESIKEVFPNEIEVIAPTSDERLTLFTCSGFADEKRLIVIAKPAK